MSVVAQFGVTADSITQLIDDHWPAWTAQAPDLALRPATTRLDQWVTSAPADDVDRVLRALARLARDEDESAAAQAATLVLVWLMMPAASMLANQLRTLDPDIDQHVAAQLWIEVRSYPWQTTGRVAANLRWNLRKHVLGDLAEPDLLRIDEQPPTEDLVREDSLLAAVEFLEEGLEAEAITQDDFDLLLAVLDAADQLHPCPRRGGLTGDKVSNTVASQLGVTGRTVRRRTKRSIAALAKYAGTERRTA